MEGAAAAATALARCGATTDCSQACNRTWRICPDTNANRIDRLTVLDNVHQALEVRQHRAAHEDGNLLHNLDARVPRLQTARMAPHSDQARRLVRKPLPAASDTLADCR